MTASGGIVSGVVIINEDFNGATNTFTTVNNSSGTSPAASVWTLTNLTNTTNEFIRSNDATQFYLSDSDQQGGGGLTNTELISPVFSLAGFADAALSFWHYYNDLGGTAEVQISTDGGTVYTLLPGCSYDSDQGTATSFKNVIVDLTSYVGQTTLRIKFKYINAPYAWWWAIDNVRVSGGATTSVVWSPSGIGSGLFTNAAATTVYTGTPTLTVYAKPAANTVYTASANSISGGCTRYSNTVTITVTPLALGTTSANQTLCGGMPANITLTGSSGSMQWQVSTDNTTFVDIVGATATPLTSAQMGSLTATRYYRATLTNGVCIANSAVVTVSVSKAIWNAGAWSNVVGPDSTMAAEFQSNFTSSINASGTAGNLSACSVSVTGGAVLFDKGTLTVQNAVSVTGGSLTFDDTLFDVSLYQPNNVANGAGVYSGGNSGGIIFKRSSKPLFKYDYTYWCSPVYPQNLLAVSPGSPNHLFLTYGTGWQYVANPATTTMVVGKGYAIRAPFDYSIGPLPPATVYLAPFGLLGGGVPNNGNLSVAIIGGVNQFNLIGNPYPSALFADDFINGNANISGTLYFWTHNTPINGSGLYALTGDYSSYNLSGGLAATNAGNSTIPNGYIASGQGFLVKGFTTSPVVFTNTMRRAGNNANFYKTSNTVTSTDLERHRYWLDITNTEGAFKQALVAYVETATLDLDRLFDGDLVESDNVISLYTQVGGKNLSIQGRPLPFEVSDLVPLSYKSTIASTYTITMPHYDGLFMEQHVYLEDKLLQVIHDLTTGGYTFATEIGTFTDRFVLRYTNEALGTDNPVFNENSVLVYKNTQGLFINTGNAIMKSVTIYDIRGRVMATQNPVGTSTTVFTTLPTTNQVLLVKIEDETGGVVTKKVVF